MEKTKEEILKRCFENMYKGLKFDDMEGFKNSKQYSSLSDCFDLINDYKLIEIEGVSGKLLSAERELYLSEQQIRQLQKDKEELIEALNSLLNPDLEKYSQICGCPMCDNGVLRNKEKQHWDNCNWNIANQLLTKHK